MRLPDFEEALGIIALLLKVDRDGVELMIRPERLHHALLAPAACRTGGPIHRTPTEITRCLLVECATGGIVPRAQGRLGWTMAIRAVELNGCRWERRQGDTARIAKFGRQLEEGIDPGEELTVFLEERIKAPCGDTQGGATKMMHITSPMTPEPKQDMGTWETAVDDGLKRFLEQRGTPGAAGTHRPNVFPINGDTPEETIELIEKRLHEADGLVVLGPHASWGAAIEVEACLRSLTPVLFLHPSDSRPSFRARHRLTTMEATIRSFVDDPDRPEVATLAIADLVYRWLDANYARIAETPRRRASLESRLSRYARAIRTNQTQLGEADERRALANAGLPLERARELIEDPLKLQFAGVAEMVALSTAYKVPANIDRVAEKPPSDRPPYLERSEVEALREVIKADRISTPEVVRMMSVAQREVAMVGRRRKVYDRNNWRNLRRTLGERS